ncbi:type IV pilus modification protein PilV [Collimonas antrihumi]|uniref:type IV pilus modification protein PilV n=1 Tax=Collimonas antrihumi TaxID=1940615 RepID=UPI001FEB53A7|nr:type IV pilus modification protein PilV [Collimonas antrihumi]
MKNKPLPNRSRQRGVGLIEVLISITISSFALLGLAGLQVTALKYQKTAQFRSLASQYSADMADRIRANVAGANSANHMYVTTDTYLALPSSPQNCTDVAATATCTPDQIATRDLYNWRKALGSAMAGGWGEVSGDSTNGFVVTVYFNEPGDGSAGGANCRSAAFASGTDITNMRCFKTNFLP